MPLIVQVVNLQGKTIEGARWEVPTPPGLQEGQSFALSLPTKDKGLVAYLTKGQNSECYLEREKGEVEVVLGFGVKRIRHMLSPIDKRLETLCLLIPANRVVEQVLVYLVRPAKVDARFVQLFRAS